MGNSPNRRKVGVEAERRKSTLNIMSVKNKLAGKAANKRQSILDPTGGFLSSNLGKAKLEKIIEQEESKNGAHKKNSKSINKNKEDAHRDSWLQK